MFLIYQLTNLLTTRKKKKKEWKVSKSAETYLTQMQLYLVVGSIESHRFTIFISRWSVVIRRGRNQIRCSRISKTKWWGFGSCHACSANLRASSGRQEWAAWAIRFRAAAMELSNSVAAVTTMSGGDDERKQTLRRNGLYCEIYSPDSTTEVAMQVSHQNSRFVCFIFSEFFHVRHLQIQF